VGLVSAALGIAGMLVLKYFLNKELGEQKIEPVTHNFPDAKIQLKKGGTIEMFSDRRQTLAVGGDVGWERRDKNEKEGPDLYLTGSGSRFEIKRDKIEIVSSGQFSRAAENPPTANQFSRIAIKQADDNREAIKLESGSSSMTVNKSGNVKIDTTKKLDLQSEKDIWLTSKAGSVNLIAKRGSVWAKGRFKHPNFTILA